MTAGRYFPVPGGQDFAGAFAIALVDLVGVGYHPDARRLIGCCGPNGAGGRNRVCGCGCEVGTERSDCIWPQAVYLDPSHVMATVPHADIELAELLAPPIDWMAIPDRPFCFSGTGAGMGYELRLNDFPEESLLTLVLGDVRTDLNDCPKVWRLTRHRGE